MANSINKLIDDKIIKRGKNGLLIRLKDIHVQEGFNKRVDDERTQAADDDLFNHLFQGKPVPPLEVRPRDDGGVWIVEGHRRHRAYLRCIRHGDLLRVKYLIEQPDGGVVIRSMNREEFKDEVLTLQQRKEQLVVLGRVFWSSSTW